MCVNKWYTSIIIYPVPCRHIQHIQQDVLFNIRNHVKSGEPPGNCVHAILSSPLLSKDLSQLQLTPDEIQYIEQKLYDGYFAFEAVTHRDRDKAICGVCGIAPVFESGDGNCVPHSMDRFG